MPVNMDVLQTCARHIELPTLLDSMLGALHQVQITFTLRLILNPNWLQVACTENDTALLDGAGAAGPLSMQSSSALQGTIHAF